VTALNDELLLWLEPFLATLGHKARRRMCPLYVAGLIGPGDRKSLVRWRNARRRASPLPNRSRSYRPYPEEPPPITQCWDGGWSVCFNVSCLGGLLAAKMEIRALRPS